MLARKAFKGGNLDDFLNAGEAEAKYGPQRYAAVSEDAWRIQTNRKRIVAANKLSKKAYELQKRQMLSDHVFLSLLGTAGMWAAFDPRSTLSYIIGTALGALYIILLQRSTDSVGASSVEDLKGGPPPIVVPVLMVLIVAKNKSLLLIPVFAGFATNYLSALSQAAYPDYVELAQSEEGKTAESKTQGIRLR